MIEKQSLKQFERFIEYLVDYFYGWEVQFHNVDDDVWCDIGETIEREFKKFKKDVWEIGETNKNGNKQRIREISRRKPRFTNKGFCRRGML